MDAWETLIQNVGCYAYDHLYKKDKWFRRLCTQVVEISGIAYFLIPEEVYVYYLRQWFRDTPDPFITNEQLSLVLRSSVVIRSRDRYELILELYQKYFPEESACAKPRSLLHLSRCKVRDCLKKNEQLPYGIQQLEIPETLQNYLELNS